MNDVKIYTTSSCSFCNSAKELFKKLGVPFEEINLDNNPELRLKLSQENNGWRSVPMIFINGKFMRGFDDINALHKNGELKKILNLT